MLKILAYHQIDDQPDNRWCVPAVEFDAHLAYLARNGYYSLSIEEYADWLDGRFRLPKKSVLITFDDGYANNIRAALPLLERYNFRATIFIIADYIGKNNSFEVDSRYAAADMLTVQELGQWLAAGGSIGSHTLSHPFLSKLSSDDKRREIEQSKSALEQLTGVEVISFCYPYGDFDVECMKLVERAGYRAAFAVNEHTRPWRIKDRYRAYRDVIFRDTSIDRLANILSWKDSVHNAVTYAREHLLRSWDARIGRRIQRFRG